MSDPFVGEIRPFAFNFTPQGWFPCDGSIQSITRYQALFAMLGFRYGGDGKTTFGLPNLQGRAVVSPLSGGALPPSANVISSSNMTLGSVWGVNEVTLSQAYLPTHSHTAQGYGSTTGVTQIATADSTCYLGLVRSGASTYDIWSSNTTPTAALSGFSISMAGSGRTHNNVQPYLPLNFCICYEGIFMPNPN
ncbi:phage tail protein [Insolitispirillum peregrinum]|uniref:phage tail protein n=1 Tax=Insolitispirillum peregrinum TaxID=80876 RepID=UPI00361BBD13